MAFVCTTCEHRLSQWAGRCPSCGEWNTIMRAPDESRRGGKTAKRSGARSGSLAPKPVALTEAKLRERWVTGMSAIDAVLGGGALSGSVILIGGEPGIGKTTLAMMMAMAWSSERPVVYVSGEEGIDQVSGVTRRLLGEQKKELPGLTLLSAFDVDDLCAVMENKDHPDVIVIDSIQTLTSADAPGLPGSPSQVRAVAQRLTEVAHATSTTLVIIGHVTKDGQVAGPKTLEHIVDVVLMLEGERFDQLRTLRTLKNRFGSTNLTALFEMAEHGLIEIKDASKRFLDPIEGAVIGTAVASVLDGQRPLFAHVQALTTSTAFGYPKRTSVGIDLNRLHLLIAIAERFGLLALSSADVFVKVAHGLKLTDPAADAAILAAIASSKSQTPLSQTVLCLGEVGMNGRISPVTRLADRLQAAATIGVTDVYARVVAGHSVSDRKEKLPRGMRIHNVTTVRDLLVALFPDVGRRMVRGRSEVAASSVDQADFAGQDVTPDATASIDI